MLTEMGKRAKAAAQVLRTAGSAQKDAALTAIADAFIKNSQNIITANDKDIAFGKDNGLSESLLDRLRLTESRIADISAAMLDIVKLPDPVGEVLEGSVRPNGLRIEKVRVPMGVIGIIYEARPNVTADAAALCLKTGNACILRGGKEAINSNKILADIMRTAIADSGLPADAVQLIEDTSRESSNALMKLNGYVDVLIPRGGAGLINAVVRNATVPVIETGVGNCHAYVDESADIDMAANIVYNAKTSRVSVCNALETLLVHSKIADKALPAIAARLNEKNVELRGCEKTALILDNVIPAAEDDYYTEFNDYILAVRVVDSLGEAIDHIAKYSSGHSETIITNDFSSAEIFTGAVDSAAVYVNASTRFTDGGEFGLGAEIGISTQKLHARGPMGLKEMTTVKYIIRGNGQIR